MLRTVSGEILDQNENIEKGKETSFICLNVGGVRFETLCGTLSSVKGSRLARLADRHSKNMQNNFQDKTIEYFFDRNPVIFERILSLYRNGELHFAKGVVCGAEIRAELSFWEIPLDLVSHCCRVSLDSFQQDLAWHEKMSSKFAVGPLPCACPPESASLWKNCQYKAYTSIERPLSSKSAMAYAVVYFLVSLTGIAVTILNTMAEFRHAGDANHVHMKDLQHISNMSNHKEVLLITSETDTTLKVLDYICLSYFTLDLIARFLIYPEKKVFFKSAISILDIVCCLMHTSCYILAYLVTDVELLNSLMPLILIFGSVTVLRLCRLIGFAYQLPIVRVLVLSLVESWKMLLLMGFVMGFGTLFFGPLMYIADYRGADSFDNMAVACWWAIVTMTTVGYGDQFPTTFVGYFVGALCALTGLILTAIPIAVVGNNFNNLYTFLVNNAEELNNQTKTDLMRSKNAVGPMEETIEMTMD